MFFAAHRSLSIDGHGEKHMSTTLWLNLREGDTYVSDEEDHTAVFCHEGALEQIAASLNVAPLTAFYDYTDVRYNLDETGQIEVSENGWPASAATWFPAASVRSSVFALVQHLQHHSGALTPTDGLTQSDVIEELVDLERALQGALASSQFVHLCIVT